MSAFQRDRQPTVVVTDCDHHSLDPERKIIAEAGIAFRRLFCATADDVAEQATDADVILNQYAPVTGDVLDTLPNCKAVIRYGVGVDNVDVEAAARRGVWVVNVPDYGIAEVADHTLALLLDVLRGVSRLDRDIRSGHWDYEAVKPLRRLSTLTLGVVGCGRIGSAVVQRARAFGTRVLVCDLTPASPPLLEQGAAQVPLAQVLEEADALSLHLPLTESTHHLIGAEELAAMRPGAVLINTARGGLVDQAALVEALETGRLAGVGLDVLEREPPDPSSPLIGRPDVVLTPHSAWYSEESFKALKLEVAREAVRVLSGERPRSPVNEPRWTRP